MIARGSVVNGANVILIDIDEQALEETKSEIEGLRGISRGTETAAVVTSVNPDRTTMETLSDWLTFLSESMATSPVKMVFKRSLSK